MPYTLDSFWANVRLKKGQPELVIFPLTCGVTTIAVMSQDQNNARYCWLGSNAKTSLYREKQWVHEG